MLAQDLQTFQPMFIIDTSYNEIKEYIDNEIEAIDYSGIHARIADVSTYSINVSTRLNDVSTKLAQHIKESENYGKRIADVSAYAIDLSTNVYKVILDNEEITAAALVDLANNLNSSYNEVVTMHNDSELVLVKSINSLRSDVVTANSSISDLSTKLANHLKESTDYGTRITNVSSYAINVSTRLKDVSDNLDSLIIDVADVSSKLNTLDAKYEKELCDTEFVIVNKFEEIEYQVSTLDAKYENELSTLDAKYEKELSDVEYVIVNKLEDNDYLLADMYYYLEDLETYIKNVFESLNIPFEFKGHYHIDNPRWKFVHS